MHQCLARRVAHQRLSKLFPSQHIRRSPASGFLIALVLLTVALPSRAGASIVARDPAAPRVLTHPETDSATVARTVARFHDAIAAGDSVTALSVLSPDVLVIESGDVETFAQYRTEHLSADIAFARAVPGGHTVVAMRVAGGTAWVTSTSVTQGSFQGRAINSAGAELMVLTRARPAGPWLIRAIHWSSHRRAK